MAFWWPDRNLEPIHPGRADYLDVRRVIGRCVSASWQATTDLYHDVSEALYPKQVTRGQVLQQLNRLERAGRYERRRNGNSLEWRVAPNNPPGGGS